MSGGVGSGWAPEWEWCDSPVMGVRPSGIARRYWAAASASDQRKMSANDTDCLRTPIVVRATTQSDVPALTEHLAVRAQRTQERSVFVLGCWAANSATARRLQDKHLRSVGLADHPACNRTWRDLSLKSYGEQARIQGPDPFWPASDILTGFALRHIFPANCTSCKALTVDPDMLFVAKAFVYRTCRTVPLNIDFAFASSFGVFHRMGLMNELTLLHTAPVQGRHLVFLGRTAARELGQLALRYNKDYSSGRAGIDMQLPNLLAQRNMSILWHHEHTTSYYTGANTPTRAAALLGPLQHCRVERIEGTEAQFTCKSTAGPSAQYDTVIDFLWMHAPGPQNPFFMCLHVQCVNIRRWLGVYYSRAESLTGMTQVSGVLVTPRLALGNGHLYALRRGANISWPASFDLRNTSHASWWVELSAVSAVRVGALHFQGGIKQTGLASSMLHALDSPRLYLYPEDFYNTVWHPQSRTWQQMKCSATSLHCARALPALHPK